MIKNFCFFSFHEIFRILSPFFSEIFCVCVPSVFYYKKVDFLNIFYLNKFGYKFFYNGIPQFFVIKNIKSINFKFFKGLEVVHQQIIVDEQEKIQPNVHLRPHIEMNRERTRTLVHHQQQVAVFLAITPLIYLKKKTAKNQLRFCRPKSKILSDGDSSSPFINSTTYNDSPAQNLSTKIEINSLSSPSSNSPLYLNSGSSVNTNNHFLPASTATHVIIKTFTKKSIQPVIKAFADEEDDMNGPQFKRAKLVSLSDHSNESKMNSDECKRLSKSLSSLYQLIEMNCFRTQSIGRN